MNQGKVIEYIDRGRVICTLCLQDKGNRLSLLTPNNREVNLSPKRALFVSGTALDPGSPREELLSRLRRTEETRNRLKEAVEVRELWELVRDEEQLYDFKYLAQLCFGEEVADDDISALVRALFEDQLYFKLKDGRFFPNSGAKVEQIVRQREEEDAWERRIGEESDLLRASLKGGRLLDAPGKEGLIALLVELALHGQEAPDLKYGKEMLARAGISHIGEARNLLIRLGVWDEDENLDLLRLEIRTGFPPEVIAASEALAASPPEVQGCEDLRGLAAFTIDGELTQDFDDALSVDFDGDSILVGIHIADVAGAIRRDSILDREAALRASSLYLPMQQIPMLPPSLSHGILSLTEGADRPAISLMARFDREGGLLEHRFTPSLIRVKRRLTYAQVDGMFGQEGLWEALYGLAQVMRRRRTEQGAVTLSLPEVFVRVEPEGSIALEMIDQETPARSIVAECMIFYNAMAARFCDAMQIPILYRSQEEPSERLPVDEGGHLNYVFQQLRKLQPLKIDTRPRPHTGLGVEAYTNVSSPIRRYLDLVVQRQIRGALFKTPPPYDDAALDTLRMSVEPLLKDLATVRRNRIRYWLQKYLAQHVGQRLQALVLITMRNRYRLLLKDLMLVTEMKRENGQTLAKGDSIWVKVKQSDPRNDALTLEYAGEDNG